MSKNDFLVREHWRTRTGNNVCKHLPPSIRFKPLPNPLDTLVYICRIMPGYATDNANASRIGSVVAVCRRMALRL
jgi:hypothetical protein